jgi:D-alanine-D-alanine ligase-like ATP-grasp enzyme
MLDVALLLGGPSSERAISLNSARSLADHLEGPGVNLRALVYFDRLERPFTISRSLLYSNTPDDFDFKLSQDQVPLEPSELRDLLRSCDLAFPAMHGSFGEDGRVQQILEDAGVPYVGSTPATCAVAYPKLAAGERLRDLGIDTIPSVLFDASDELADVEGDTAARQRRAEQVAVEWLLSGALSDGNRPLGFDDLLGRGQWLVVKPVAGGSSYGLAKARLDLEDPDASLTLVAGLASGHIEHGPMLVQPYVDGIEVTTVVVEGPGGPVALPPVEVELRNRDDDRPVLTYRDKYMPSDDTHYHCPPRRADGRGSGLSDEAVDRVRAAAEETFARLGMRDFARVDCRVTPDGRVLVADLNVISGMEQNSFIFIQAGQVGMTHRDALRTVLLPVCRRAGLDVPAAWTDGADVAPDRTPVTVLFGGPTAERHVSVLSGTNVWLKLLHSARYEPRPYLLSGTLDDGEVWELTYPLALRHSVEQIAAACEGAADAEDRRVAIALDVARRLQLEPWQQTIDRWSPKRLTPTEVYDESAFVFIALHGGAGEDGRLQRILDERGIPYNGCGPEASKICMDKAETGARVAALGLDGVSTAPKLTVPLAELLDGEDTAWNAVTSRCGSAKVVVKPVADGCSAGVVPLISAAELKAYVDAVVDPKRASVKPGTFKSLDREQIVDLPTSEVTELLFERFIETDKVTVEAATGTEGGSATEVAPAELRWVPRGDPAGWIEVTVGLLGLEGQVRALSPSLTIANQGVLSVEEKFMGGTGVNITPPPSPDLGRVLPSAVETARSRIAAVANDLGIRGYSRLDAFLDATTGDVIVIEVNSLPGLSPATVFYHQALAEEPPMFPGQLLEHIIDLGLEAAAPVHG